MLWSVVIKYDFIRDRGSCENFFCCWKSTLMPHQKFPIKRGKFCYRYYYEIQMNMNYSFPNQTWVINSFIFIKFILFSLLVYVSWFYLETKILFEEISCKYLWLAPGTWRVDTCYNTLCIYKLLIFRRLYLTCRKFQVMIRMMMVLDLLAYDSVKNGMKFTAGI